MLSPGVVMGNSTNPMKNILFDNIFFTHGRLPFHTKRFPFNGKVQCDNTVGICKVYSHVPDCFEVVPRAEQA